jgi:hypothetical protein
MVELRNIRLERFGWLRKKKSVESPSNNSAKIRWEHLPLYILYILRRGTAEKLNPAFIKSFYELSQTAFDSK